MISSFLSLRRLSAPFLALGIALSVSAPAQATISTVFSCPSTGSNGQHDYIYNGFYVQGLGSLTLHSVTLYYKTDQAGTYTLMLTARRNSYAGTQVGQTLTKTVALSTSSDTAVTWDFGDVALPSATNLYFTHTQSGPGGVLFNLNGNGCPGDEETVGTSSNLNNFSVATVITQNTTTSTACFPNAQTLCIDDQAGDKRFQIRVTYSTTLNGGLSGNGQAIPLSPLGVNRGGLFWFFSSDNPEMLVKVLNGCSLNNVTPRCAPSGPGRRFRAA